MIKLAPLRAAPRTHAPQVRPAYRLLRGAHDSVSGLFDVVQDLSVVRRDGNPTRKGPMVREEVDILRAAVVLTSSGLDASMQRLVRDVGGCLILRPGTGARKQYEEYMKAELSGGAVGIRDAVLGFDPKTSLLDYYLAARTKASLQGSGDLKVRVRCVLGISKSVIPDTRLEALDQFFTVRNSIVHKMDYQKSSGATTARNKRAPDDVAAMCASTFRVAADFMHAAAAVLK